MASERDLQPSPIRLGPFLLHEPVGRGGMGAVWSGVHDDGVPVAVKVLDTQVTEEELDESFKNEVRAVTRLDHPGVVWVYDIGQVDEAAASRSSGRLAAGCPYIAMEFAGRGTLRDWGRLPWEGVREVLLALLDALAHAHARGVIHQDLKPANVLVCGPEDLRPGLKLADFGIAHAVERRGKAGSRTAIGTVQYMAPEQIRAETWECGAWTDIYSLGCVAWQLLTGEVPYHAYSGVALVRAQLEEPLPDAGIRAPAGFREWFRRCVAKNPRERFRRAADAADALMELPDLVDHGPVRADDQLDRLPTIRVDRFAGLDDDDPPRTDPLTGDERVSPKTGLPVGIGLETGLVSFQIATTTTRGQGEGAAPVTVRRLVDDWRRHDTPRRSLQLLGAGLKLWGVRRSPMVGRIDERDQLWGLLKDVVQSGTQRAVVMTGAAGTGKTRLGSWLGERAHELGVASSLKTRFFEGDGDGAVRRMWTRYLRMAEVEQGGRGKWWAKSLARLGLGDRLEAFAVLVGPGDAHQRHERSAEMMRAMTAERPVVMMLDDVHVGIDGLELARCVLSAAPMPVLVVLSARSEALVDRADERELLGAISAMPRTTGLTLGPLPLRDHVTLVEEVLGLSPSLAAQVAERTGGNPLFALELIGDWIRRGILTLSPAGFEVRPGEVAELPGDMREVWTARVERVLDGLSDKAGPILERAAFLGIAVGRKEWQLACDDPDAAWVSAGRDRVVPENESLRDQLVERLLAGRLAELTESGFTFAHGMIREAVLARAEERSVEHHLACARILRFVDDQEATAERIGRHLLDAGEPEAAVEPLLLGVIHRRDTAGARSALGLLATAEEALARVGLPDTDPRWAECRQLRGMLWAELGDVAEAERSASMVIAFEDRRGWLPHALDARLTMGRMWAAQGEIDRAFGAFSDILARSEDPVQQGLAHAELALVTARRRDALAAKGHTDAAVRLLRRGASSRALAECWRVVGMTALINGNDRQAEDALARGMRLYKLRGNLIGQAECLAGLGRAAMWRGDTLAAEERLKESIHLYEVAGNGDIVKPRADLARLRLEASRFDEARDLLSNLRLQLQRQGRVGAVAGLGAMQVAAAVGCLDWEELEHRLSQVEDNPAVEVGDRGGWALSLASELAAAAGDLARAARLRSLADDLADGGRS